MADRTDDFGMFLRQLRERKIAGDAGRIMIAERLASMTLDELRRVPPWLIVRLGPKGLALLAERSRVVRLKTGGAPTVTERGKRAVPAPMKPPTLSRVARLNRRQPLWWECTWKMTRAALAGGLLIAAVSLLPRVIPIFDQPLLTIGDCTRLDRWTGDCMYHVGTSGLSLNEAADRLALPVAKLAAANPSVDPICVLPAGTFFLVPRRGYINLR